MKYDKFGVAYCTVDELANMLYKEPTLDLSKFRIEDPVQFNNAVGELYADMDKLVPYVPSTATDIDEFDRINQENWLMPDEYKQLDIAKFVLDQCNGDAELQRAGEELLLFQERNMFDLLRYLKFMVDTLRRNGVFWGVGRGSSVASFVLYLIGVHRINSLYYGLPITEFLK